MPTPTQTHAVIHAAPPMRAPNQVHAHHQDRTFVDHRNLNSNFCAGFPGAQIIDPVPSFGFSFSHMQAVQGDLGIKAAIDPATQLRLAAASRFGCGGVGTGGLFLLDGGYGYGYGMPEPAAEETQAEPTPAAQPQVIVIQQPSSNQVTEGPMHVAAEEATPLPGPGQLILVMRDGSQVQALAFTHSGDTVIYITPEGIRRTVSVGNIDSEATVRVNSDRGAMVQSL